jgi:hypothetical protein
MRFHVQAFLAAFSTAAIVLLLAIVGAAALLSAFAQFSNAEIGSVFDIYLQLARFIIPATAITAFFLRKRTQEPRLTMLKSIATGSSLGLVAIGLTFLACWGSVSHALP